MTGPPSRTHILAYPAIVWSTGLAALAKLPLLRPTVVEVASHGKGYYIASRHTTLFAFGAVAIEAALRHSWARGALVLAFGMLGAPMAIRSCRSTSRL